MRATTSLLLLLTGCTTQYSFTSKDDGDGSPDTDLPPGPDIRVSPSFLDFETLPPGCESEPLLVTIENLGKDPLQLVDVKIGGPARDAFHLTDPLMSLASGESTEARVSFAPSSLGKYDEASLVLETNDPDEATVEVGLQGEGANELTVEDTFVQTSPLGIDLLVLLDTSHTMEGDLEELQTHFATFILNFLRLGLDYHIGVMPIDDGCPRFVGPIIDTSTPDPVAAWTALVNTDMCDDNEHTYDLVTKAFTPPNLAENAGFLRDDANLALVVFTDEPEQSGDYPLNAYKPGDFARFLRNLKGGDPSKVTFSGLVGPETAGGALNCLLHANPQLWGDSYQKAIALTNGYHGDICHVRMQPFVQMLERTASGLTYEFTLSHEPQTNDTSQWELTVDGVAQTDGWTYDPGTMEISFDNDHVPKPGTTIVVRYVTETSDCP